MPNTPIASCNRSPNRNAYAFVEISSPMSGAYYVSHDMSLSTYTNSQASWKWQDEDSLGTYWTVSGYFSPTALTYSTMNAYGLPMFQTYSQTDDHTSGGYVQVQIWQNVPNPSCPYNGPLAK
jgi:hypothetical protein